MEFYQSIYQQLTVPESPLQGALVLWGFCLASGVSMGILLTFISHIILSSVRTR